MKSFSGLVVILFVLGVCQTQAQIPSNGLLAYYPFNGNANDSSGNGHHGIVYGATLTADRFGDTNSAYYFDGLSNRIELGSWFNYNVFSISMWVKPDSIQTTLADIIDNNHNTSRSWTGMSQV